MASEKSIIFATVLAAALALVESAPSVVNLRDVVNRTVCPFRVEIDEDLDRVPRHIKMIRCAEEPNQFCRSQNIPDNECCHHKHFDYSMECVEVRDPALVYIKSRKQTESFDVIVGCACMFSTATAVYPSS